MYEHPNVLLLSTDKTVSSNLQNVLRELAILTRVDTLSELGFHLKRSDYDALFCAWSFHTGSWNDALKVVWKCRPDLPVIVLARIAEEQEWLQALETGAFDLLVPPFQSREILAVLEQASATRQARASRSLAQRLKESA